jgi:hypothetical protein
VRYGVEILSSEPQPDFNAITGDPVNKDNRAGAPKDPGPVVLVTADYFMLPNTRTWFPLSQ